MKTRFTRFYLLCVVMGVLVSQAVAEPRVDAVLDVAPVWPGHPVGFCLLTRPPYQFVGFYDAERRMTVAQRKLDDTAWQFTILDEQTGWDSHNYVTIALDAQGFLHLCGNMHCVPLVYFRSAKPFDAASLLRVPAMTESEEQQVTYPRFLEGPKGELVFTYRDGRSGSGNQIFNSYDIETKTWRRLLDKPLMDGEGARNAYFHGPVPGPDGYFHLCWVWRESPDCATNHDLSYARSKDLVHWEHSDGTAYTLPITLATAEVVDPVPAGGGMINGNAKLGFDARGSVVIGYHKHDERGYTQAYVARREVDGWHHVVVSDWQYHWDFSGGGSIPFDIRIGAPKTAEDGGLVLPFSHKQFGSGRVRVDSETLRRIEVLGPEESRIPKGLSRAQSTFPGVEVRFEEDSGRAETGNVSYCLRWETLGPNRDRPRDPPWPEPTMLRLYRLAQ